MSDIVERVRAADIDILWRDMLAEIENQRAEIARLREERNQLIEQIGLRQPSIIERDMQEVMRINNELIREARRALDGEKG